MSESHHVIEQLGEYVVGRLRGRGKARVERHLSQCPACRQELAALERTGALLSSISTDDAPAGTWEAIRERIAEPRRAPARRRLRLAWGVAMGAIALLFVVLGAFLLHPLGGGEPALLVLAEPDEEMQATIEGHRSTMWAAPLADEAAVGLRLVALESNG